MSVISGYYVNEPDDVDVPLSKRINRLNIENSTSTIPTELSPSIHNNTGINSSDRTHSPLESLCNNLNVNSGQVSFQQLPPANDNSPLMQLQSIGLSNSEHASGLSFQTGTAINNTTSGDVAYSHELISESSPAFKENYNYPENSTYYKSNQLLNSLFLERQMRQNNT